MFVPGGEPPPGARTYRSASYALIGTAMVGLIALAAVALVLVAPEPALAWGLAAVAIAGALAWLAVRCYLAPKVVVSAEGVLVVNPFQRRLVRWEDIERFDSRPGLTVVRRDGPALTAWALPTPFSARATTGAETLADHLGRRLEAERAAPR